MKNYFLLFLVLILSFFNAKSQINIEDKDIKLVYYNIYTMESKLLKNKKSVLIISILAGLIASTIFVLISSTFNQRNSH